MKKFACAALFALALTGAALAQQGDHIVRANPQAEDNVAERERAVTDSRASDDFGRAASDMGGGEALCSEEAVLAGRCTVVARLPRCPGDPRCPDPTRVRPDTETPE